MHARETATTSRRGKAPPLVREMFSGIAPWYDFLNRFLSGGLDAGWRRRAAEALAGVAPLRRVVDLCTGTGDMAWALRRAGRVDVTGIDFTPEMIRRAPRKGGGGGLRPHWAVADGLRLPFPSGTFDAASAAFGVRSYVDLSGGLREAARVLRPGGRLVLLEFGYPRPAWLRGLYRIYFERVLPVLGDRLSGNRAQAYGYLRDTVMDFPADEALQTDLRAAGFRTAVTLPLTFGVVRLHCADR